MKRLKIGAISFEDNGVGWWRVIHPLKGMTLDGTDLLVEVRHTPFSGHFQVIEDVTDEDTFREMGEWADIIYSTAPKNHNQFSLLLAIKVAFKRKVVIDIDDYLSMLNYDHPNRAMYEREDVNNPAYIAYNSLKMADAVVTTNEFLKDAYSRFNKNVYINKNTMHPLDWDKLPKPRPHKKIRIGWAGAAGHLSDLKMVSRAMNDVRAKYKGKVEVCLFGDRNEEFKIDRYQKFVWVTEYLKTYKKQGFDIAIAPMVDSAYNRGKSNLRLLEAGVNRIPIVASPVGPYKDFPCLHAKTYDEWVKHLSRLVESPQLRRQVGDACRKEVENKYSLERESKNLYNFLVKLSKKKTRTATLDEYTTLQTSDHSDTII